MYFNFILFFYIILSQDPLTNESNMLFKKTKKMQTLSIYLSISLSRYVYLCISVYTVCLIVLTHRGENCTIVGQF